MNPVSIALIVGAVATAVAQFLDAYTTYEGVVAKKIAVEANQSAVAQFLIKHPKLMLVAKPGAAFALLAATLWASFLPASIAILGLYAYGIYNGASAAIHNMKVNG